MPRNDTHLDTMLRHLGAAYYESLHGRATRADVTRALGTVEEHLNEQTYPDGSAETGPARHREHPAASRTQVSVHSRGWSRRVSDVMTTSVITVDRITPYKEIAALLAEHRISGVPVLKMGREVAGVVTEADLVAAQADAMRQLRAATRPGWLRGRRRHPAVTAGELMTSPAVTIGPLATVPAAARLMTDHHVRRLPVVDEHGRLVGIVSRRDLLSVFLRPDEDIAADIRTVLDEVLAEGPDEAHVSVRNGIVTLTGTLDPNAGPHGDLIPVAMRLMWDIDGVVNIIDRLGNSPAAAPAESAEPDEPSGPDEAAPPARTGPRAHGAG